MLQMLFSGQRKIKNAMGYTYWHLNTCNKNINLLTALKQSNCYVII